MKRFYGWLEVQANTFCLEDGFVRERAVKKFSFATGYSVLIVVEMMFLRARKNTMKQSTKVPNNVLDCPETARAFFSRMYQQAGPLVLHRCRAILKDEQEAMDALQDIFCKIMSCFEQYQRQKELLPWVLSITTNYCIDRLRQRRSLVPIEDLADDLKTDSLPMIEQRQWLHVFLSRFDKQTQSIIVYSLVDGFTQSQIAILLRISEKTVHRRIKKFSVVLERMQKNKAGVGNET